MGWITRLNGESSDSSYNPRAMTEGVDKENMFDELDRAAAIVEELTQARQAALRRALECETPEAAESARAEYRSLDARTREAAKTRDEIMERVIAELESE